MNLRDSSSLSAPQNDGLEDFFNSLLKHGKNECFVFRQKTLARIFHELLAATTDLAILPGVLGCRSLRRTVQVRLGTNTLRLPGGKPTFVVSRQQFMKYPG
jgi:hypothetical protein